jgi:hypothetical protein
MKSGVSTSGQRKVSIPSAEVTRLGTVDPGTETGWCRLEFPLARRKELVRSKGPLGAIREIARGGGVSVGTWKVGPETWRDRFGEDKVMRYFDQWQWSLDLLVIEDFILRRSEKSRSLLSPVRLGASMNYSWTKGGGAVSGIGVRWQSPTDKSVFTDERLKGAKLWTGGAGAAHVRDAVRHMGVLLGRLDLENP